MATENEQGLPSNQMVNPTTTTCTNTSCCPPNGETFKRIEEKVGRNAPCPCGNGKKYKKCCGRSR